MPVTRAARSESRRRGALRRAAAIGVLTLLGACVTYDVDDDAAAVDPLVIAQPIAVPLGGSGSDDPDLIALDAYYGSVVAQMQDAVVERDPELLASLLAVHDRAIAPEWARSRIAAFRGLLHGLEFEIAAQRSATLQLVGAEPALGEAVPFVLRVPDGGASRVEVPGEDSGVPPARILVAVVVVDHDCFGGHTRREFSEILPLLRSARFDAGGNLELRFGLPELVPAGCWRLVDVSCDLLPGNLLLDGDPLPNQRARLASCHLELFPRGIEMVRANPFAHLRAGLELGDPAHFDNVFLAAHCMKAEFREDALRKLIEGLRLGRPDVARLCMAALREMTGESISVEDRDGWLAWWQSRPTGDAAR